MFCLAIGPFYVTFAFLSDSNHDGGGIAHAPVRPRRTAAAVPYAQ